MFGVVGFATVAVVGTMLYTSSQEQKAMSDAEKTAGSEERKTMKMEQTLEEKAQERQAVGQEQDRMAEKGQGLQNVQSGKTAQ